MLAAVVCLVVAACGGGSAGDTTETEPVQENGDSTGTEAVGAGGDVSAAVTVGGESWELPNVACVVRTNSFELIAAEGIIGVSSGPTVSLKVDGDPLDTEAGNAEVAFFSGPLTDPDIAWTSSTGIGDAVVSTDGSRVTMTGLFDDALTDSVEAVEGAVDADCGEMPEVPVVTTTLPPDYSVDGTVTVGGETFSFTYDPEAGGICDRPGNEGRVATRGWLVDDPSREVTFTYGLPEATSDGEPHLQLIIYDADGQQLWYSAVGFISGSSTGSVDSLTKEGDTVNASGTLLRSGSNPEELAEFTVEATCSQ